MNILLFGGVACKLDAGNYWKPLVWFAWWLLFSFCTQPLLLVGIPDLYVLPREPQSPLRQTYGWALTQHILTYIWYLLNVLSCRAFQNHPF